MKVSLNWIRDYVKLPEDMDLKRLAYDLTMSTVEVEDAVDLGASFRSMVVGEIREILPHPNADKLRICRTDIGGGDIREIVCGGSNLRDGMKVAVALPGSVCRWHGEGEPVEIKKSKLRGVDSYGMICGAVEIGLDDLFPADGEAVILDLSDFDAPAGTPLADALELNDIILEIDNKSMTNRPDLWGHYGIARELAALYAQKARQARYRGLFCVVSDPVDPLCRAVLEESNRDETGRWDGGGLFSHQVRGFGLGVMNARAAYFAKQDPRFRSFLLDGRSYGPHGQGLVIANSLSHYDDGLSRELTELVATANLRIRELGFKPYVAPAISSGAMQLLLTLRRSWHCSSVALGVIWFGVRNRLTAAGLEIETASLPTPLFERLRETQTLLREII